MTNNPLKIGDEVKCLDCSPHKVTGTVLDANKVYKIKEFFDKEQLYLEEHMEAWYSKRFVTVGLNASSVKIDYLSINRDICSG